MGREPSFYFNFDEGRILARKFEVVSKLGQGWEGEVYLLQEVDTGIQRAAKFFYPERNPKNKSLVAYAKKLHKLRHCPVVIQYATQELIRYKGENVHFLVSEYVGGRILSEFILKQPGKRLHPFQALHLLHALAKGVEDIHRVKEYHGDIHTENIIVQQYGLGFKIKLLDFFHWSASKTENIHDDVCFMIEVFYDALGGRRMYSKLPQEIKDICCGLKKSLIKKKFKNAGWLKRHIETMDWKQKL